MPLVRLVAEADEPLVQPLDAMRLEPVLAVARPQAAQVAVAVVLVLVAVALSEEEAPRRAVTFLVALALAL